MSDRMQGNKLGRLLLGDAIKNTREIGKIVGIHGMVLTALDESKVAFYEKLGFRKIGEQSARPKMLLPIRSADDLGPPEA